VAQKTSDCELIIIDGASSDTTTKIVESYEEQIDVFISESDEGVYDAWNKGIKLSRGEWIMFVGADDQLFPNALESYLNILNTNLVGDDVNYICGINEFLDNEGKSLKVFGEPPHWNHMRKMMVAAHVASLHNRVSLFEAIGLYNTRYKICADYELLLRKGKDLKFYFHPVKIAKMAAGGMSFSFRAIYETFRIRRDTNSLPVIINILMFGLNVVAFYFFLARKKIMGFKL